MSKRTNGRHRAPSRLDNAVVVSARATAVLAATGGMASLAVPANAAPVGGGQHTITLTAQDQTPALPAVQDPTLNQPIAELPTNINVQGLAFGQSTGSWDIVTTATAAADDKAQEQGTEAVSRSEDRAELPAAGAAARPAAGRPAATQASKPAAKIDDDASSSVGAGGAAIAAAARAQVGVNQDCTSLVNNALRRAGYNLYTGTLFSGLGMVGYSVSNPQPGDIIYYTAERHVAIYIGNGMAVHGGYLGYTTRIDSVSTTPGGVIYRRVG